MPLGYVKSPAAIVATVEVRDGLKWKISVRESSWGGQPHHTGKRPKRQQRQWKLMIKTSSLAVALVVLVVVTDMG